MRKKRSSLFFSLLFLLVFLTGAVAGRAVETVSPGAQEHAALVEGLCPTFSWGVVPEAELVELVIYALGPDDLVTGPPLHRRLPGSAGSWTPAMGDCLQAGHRYAWSVRAHLDGEASEWSETLLFRTREAPTLTEVEEALEILQRAVGADRAGGAIRGGGSAPRATVPLSRLDAGPATRAAPVLGPVISLTVDGDLSLADASDVFKDGEVFVYDEATTTGLGRGALASNLSNEAAGEGVGNTAVGFQALTGNETGNDNTAVGHKALGANKVTSRNTAVGAKALALLELIGPSSGGDNTAVGAGALSAATGVDLSTAVGSGALASVDGAQGNTAVGVSALTDNVDAPFNVAVGMAALASLVSLDAGTGGTEGNTAVGAQALLDLKEGEGNIAIGDSAGSSLISTSTPTASLNHNIYLGHPGAADEVHTMRLGRSFFSAPPSPAVGQSRTFIAGILGNTAMGTHEVRIRADGEMVQGPAVMSSKRFKRDIEEIGSISSKIWDLRPVVFHFDEELSKGDPEYQFGLIAEEVARVFPELVEFDQEGRPYSVKYRFLSVLLLNELHLLRDRLEEVDRERAAGRIATDPKPLR